ncbi:MAG: hypothetical protein JWP74_1586 [Marmoricola sp.]|nr:hypothetical protein [Marmoricola sp.]
MSKERARRREVREHAAAAQADVRAAQQARAARRSRRGVALRRLVAPLLPGSRPGQQTGVLAQRRRTRMNLIVASLLFAQVVIWIVRPDWQARLAGVVIAAIAFPVIAAFAF